MSTISVSGRNTKAFSVSLSSVAVIIAVIAVLTFFVAAILDADAVMYAAATVALAAVYSLDTRKGGSK